MGGFFGIASRHDCMADVFFGVDYHSHLGTRRGGMAAYDKEIGLQRKIHNIENSPFRTKFEHIFDEMHGTSAIGCISDSDPQPMLIRSKLGTYAITTVGIVNNYKQLIDDCLNHSGVYFDAMTGGRVNSTELVAALINQKATFVEGIQYAQSVIEGTANILILTDEGKLIAARDKLGRIPVQIGKNEDGYCASFEEFAFTKLDYEKVCELGPGEIVELTPDSMTQLAAPGKEMRVCAFLWSYYGYPTSTYEGINVEAMRYRNGAAIAERDMQQGRTMDIDYVGGVPDSGTPHAIGYANRTGKAFARAFIKYTPTWSRSFTSAKQVDRQKIAKMKQIPVHELIKGKHLLFGFNNFHHFGFRFCPATARRDHYPHLVAIKSVHRIAFCNKYLLIVDDHCILAIRTTHKIAFILCAAIALDFISSETHFGQNICQCQVFKNIDYIHPIRRMIGIDCVGYLFIIKCLRVLLLHKKENTIGDYAFLQSYRLIFFLFFTFTHN